MVPCGGREVDHKNLRMSRIANKGLVVCLIFFDLCSLIGASLSEPHTSVTALCMRVSIYLSMDQPLTGNFKSADLQNLYVHVCTSNSNLILKMIMEFSRSSSTTVDLLSARDCILSERKGLLPGYSVGAKETESEDDHNKLR